MRLLLISSLMVLLASPATATATTTRPNGTKTIVLYLDGARVEEEVGAGKGYVEVKLPAGVQPLSLRIKPVGRSVISRVEVASPRPPEKTKEQVGLEDRRERLVARLKALETREEIFTAAAKAQSGKAPRKTKTNPEPLTNIRRGTDFALAQLEEVYRRRQQTEKELREVERLLPSAKSERSEGGVARIWMKVGGQVVLSYLLPSLSWKPFYDFRVGGNGAVEVTQRAVLPRMEKGARLFVAASFLAAPDAGTWRKVATTNEPVQTYTFVAEREVFSAALPSSLVLSLTSHTAEELPPGEAACFKQGEYLGAFSFSGMKSGETRELVCGR